MKDYENMPKQLLEMEDLLLRKSPEQLTDAEKLLLLNVLGSEEQIVAYRNMLLFNVEHLQPAAKPQLLPDAAIKARLQKRFAKKHARAHKSGFGAFVWAVLDLFTFQHPAQSGIAVAMVLVSLWFGSSFDNQTISTGSSISDTIKAMETPLAFDTSSTLSNADSNTRHFAPNSNIANTPSTNAMENKAGAIRRTEQRKQ